jgi:hypothetical protein
LSVVANDNFVGIGEDYIPSARYFNGTIDEVRIWNVARDSSSIRRDMHRVFSSAPPGLVAYYTFDVAKNDTALDLVAGNEATLMNFNFDNSDGWVLQTIPAGQGTSADTSGFTTGTASLGNVSLATTDDFDNSVELIATSIGASPDSLPVGSSTVLGDRYWTIDVYGTPGTFSTCLTFTVPASFTNNGAASPALYTLYTRTSTSDGAWSPVVSGASNLTSTTVSFCGVTGFCQFAIGTDDVLPIQLASLTGKVIDGGSVELDWSTVSETNNYGFYVERKQQGSPSFATVSKLIPGAGTSLALHRYSWTDNAVTSGSYVYRLRQVDLSGHSSYSQQVVVAGVTGVRETGLPKEFGLSQNYPNPFNPTTVVKYQLPVTSHVKLVVYDVLGQAVATLADGVQEAGYKSTTFDGSRFSSGVYVYRIEAGSYTKTMKLLLVK